MKKFRFAVSTVAVIGVFFIYMIYKPMIPTEYKIFTEERINVLEHEYNMDLSGAYLKRYWIPVMAQDTYDCLCFSTDNYEDFMNNNYFGEVVKSYQNDSHFYYVCRPYYNSNDRTKVRFKFREKDGRFSADLVGYYE